MNQTAPPKPFPLTWPITFPRTPGGTQDQWHKLNQAYAAALPSGSA